MRDGDMGGSMSDVNPPYTELPDIDLLTQRIMEAVDEYSHFGGGGQLGTRNVVEVTISWSNRGVGPSEPVVLPIMKHKLASETKAALFLANRLWPHIPGPWRVLPGLPRYVVDRNGGTTMAREEILPLLHILAGLKRKAIQGVLAAPGYRYGVNLDEFPLIMDRLGERFLLRFRAVDEVLTRAALEVAVLIKECSTPAKPTTGRRRI